MRLLKWLCRRYRQDPMDIPSTLDEARRARRQSEADLDRIVKQRIEVSRIVSDLPQPDRLAELFVESIRKNPRHG